MDILRKIIFILLVIAFPLGEITRIRIDEVSITLMDLGVFAGVFGWYLFKKRIPKTRLTKPLLIFAGVLLISLLINANRLEAREFVASSLYLGRWVFYAGLFFVFSDLKLARTLVERWLIIGGSFILGFGLIQYFLYPDLRNLFYLGWDEHLYRMFTFTFLDPNFAGSFFVLFFLLIFEYLLVKKKSRLIKIITLTTFIAIVLTFSRSAYLAFIIGVLTYSIFRKRAVLGLLTTAVFILSVYSASILVLRSEGTNLLRTASGEARIESFNNAVSIIKDYPVLGVGFNSYRYAQKDYGFIDESKMLIHSAAGTDNSFLFVLATSGIVGFAAFLYLWFKIITVRDPLITSSAFAIFVSSFFVNSLFFPPIMLWLWVLIAVRENS